MPIPTSNYLNDLFMGMLGGGSDESYTSIAADADRFRPTTIYRHDGPADYSEERAQLEAQIARMTQPEQPESPMYTIDDAGNYDFSRADKGIGMAPITAETLKKIRDQAGGIAGAGGFSQSKMTPELEARLQANQEYVDDSYYREAMDNLTSRYGSGTEDPARSANAMSYLMGQQRLTGRDRLHDAQLEQLMGDGQGGKIPYEKYAKMDPELAAKVPMGMIGQDREEVLMEVNRAAESLRSAMTMKNAAEPGFSRTARRTMAKLMKIKQMTDPDKMMEALLAVQDEANQYYADNYDVEEITGAVEVR